MQAHQFDHVARCCSDCDRDAIMLVLVPWIHMTTREEGASWTPLCRHCEPADEWQTVILKNTSPERVEELLTEFHTETY